MRPQASACFALFAMGLMALLPIHSAEALTNPRKHALSLVLNHLPMAAATYERVAHLVTSLIKLDPRSAHVYCKVGSHKLLADGAYPAHLILLKQAAVKQVEKSDLSDSSKQSIRKQILTPPFIDPVPPASP